eukprot:UN01864
MAAIFDFFRKLKNSFLKLLISAIYVLNFIEIGLIVSRDIANIVQNFGGKNAKTAAILDFSEN